MEKYIKHIGVCLITLLSFSSACKKDKNEGLVRDVDGNVYHTIKIGEQTWMVENLKTTNYNDNTPISKVNDKDTWVSNSIGAYCNFNNEDSKSKYGHLYNSYAVNTGKLAPKGWHVPTDADWIQLKDYLIANGYNYDGSKVDNKIAKSLASTTEWALSGNTGVIGNDLSKNNKSGFTAYPAGYRDSDGNFYGFTGFACYWTSSQNLINTSVYFVLSSSDQDLFKGENLKVFGYSVRCIKD